MDAFLTFEMSPMIYTVDKTVVIDHRIVAMQYAIVLGKTRVIYLN